MNLSRPIQKQGAEVVQFDVTIEIPFQTETREA